MYLKSAGNAAAAITRVKGMPTRSATIKTAAAIIGGVNWPPEDAAASTAPAKFDEKPCFLIIGIVKTPVPAILAATDPLIIPKIALATIAAWAEPPRIFPVKAVEIVIKL